MELVDLIVGGAGVVKGLLLFVGLGMDEKTLKEDIKRYYDEFMKMKGAPAPNGKADELIAFISNDEFKPDTYKRSENWGYLATLKNLKEKMVKFYFTSIDELKEDEGKFTDIRDVHLRINEYLLQLMRLRMLIAPDYKLSKNKHPQTNHTYFAVKAYWIDDEGKKVRQFARSMGREETYKGGIKGEQAMNEGLNVIQPVIYDYYKKIYPD